ncbi:hypothetical protein LJB86_02025 [Deltaproteobacteria bacterium OttesenSCG-928-M10]|nr:hypothetical protein [Deltaproteobacteria bacterium OttesenSCG-928-M10]
MTANPILTAPDETLVCYCGGVSKKTILTAIAQGHITIKALKAVTGVCPDNNDCVKNNPLKRCCCTEINALINDYLTVSSTDKDGLKPIKINSCCGKG